jgi:hypothetical protein
MKFTLLGMIVIGAIALTSCATDQNPPELEGHHRYPGALPSPANFQKNSAINASTMIPQR